MTPIFTRTLALVAIPCLLTVQTTFSAPAVAKKETAPTITKSLTVAKTYQVETRSKKSKGNWAPGGTWTIGGRDNQPIVAMSVTSTDNGLTLIGTCTYDKEGPIAFRAKHLGNNAYAVENQWGGDKAKWHAGGTWILGDRKEARVTTLDFYSDDKGLSYTGTLGYSGEGGLQFRAKSAPPVEEKKKK